MTACAPFPGLAFTLKAFKTVRNFVTDDQRNLTLVQRANKAVNGIYVDSTLVWCDDIEPLTVSTEWNNLIDSLKEYSYSITTGAFQEEQQLIDTKQSPWYQGNVRTLTQQESGPARSKTIKYYSNILANFVQQEHEAEQAELARVFKLQQQREVVRDATFEEAFARASELFEANKSGFVCTVSKQFDNGYTSVWEYDVNSNGTATSSRPNGNCARATFNNFEEFADDLKRYYYVNDFEIRMA